MNISSLSYEPAIIVLASLKTADVMQICFVSCSGFQVIYWFMGGFWISLDSRRFICFLYRKADFVHQCRFLLKTWGNNKVST